MTRGTPKERTGRTEVILSEKDRLRLELIREVFGLSMSSALRVALKAACEKLGVERATPDDFLRKRG